MQNHIEGRNPVLEALRAGRPIHRLLMSRDVDRHTAVSEILHLCKSARIPIEYVTAEVIKLKSVTKNAQGVIALSTAKAYVEVHDLFSISEQRNETPFYIMLDGLEDPHNLGAIIRTADGAGAHGVIIPERRSVGLTEIVAKVSAGAIEYVPVARINNINNAIRLLKEKGVWIIGVDEDGDKKYHEMDYKLPVTIVIGGEGKGISRLVGENCDQIVSIPMKGHITSLNASVAAAIMMYEVSRQRGI